MNQNPTSVIEIRSPSPVVMTTRTAPPPSLPHFHRPPISRLPSVQFRRNPKPSPSYDRWGKTRRVVWWQVVGLKSELGMAVLVMRGRDLGRLAVVTRIGPSWLGTRSARRLASPVCRGRRGWPGRGDLLSVSCRFHRMAPTCRPHRPHVYVFILIFTRLIDWNYKKKIVLFSCN